MSEKFKRPYTNLVPRQSWNFVQRFNIKLMNTLGILLGTSLRLKDAFEKKRGIHVGVIRVNTYGFNPIKTRGLTKASGEVREKLDSVESQKANNEPSQILSSQTKTTEQENFYPKNFKEMGNDNGLFIRSVTSKALKESWYQLRSNPGMLIKGSGEETIGKISDAWFQKISELLKEGRMKYPPARRKEIPKSAGKTRPLAITNPRIKVIERALLNALEPIFEGIHEWKRIPKEEYEKAKLEKSVPEFKENYQKKTEKKVIETYKKEILMERIFKPTSFGFRTGKSAHQALHRIKTEWRNNTVYFLDYDIKKAFDNVNRGRLKNVFNRYVKDQRFWNELAKLLKAGYIKEDLLQESSLGVNQGSILSPFLFNVYMHDLDVFVERLNKKVSINNKHSEEIGYGDPEAKRNYRKLNTKYSENLLKTYKNLGSKEKFSSEKKREFLEHYKKYGRKLGIDKTNRYIQYLRYADDFLIGIIGPRSFAVAMQKEIDTFIKSDLHLKVSKNSIIHRDQPAVTFLGHKIQLVHFHGKTRTKQRHMAALARFRNRAIQRLKAQNVTIAKAALNRLRSKILKQIDSIAKQLNINYSNQNLDTYAAILAFKSIGETLTKSLKLSNFEELTGIMKKIDESTDISNPAIRRLYNQFKLKAELNEEIAANCIWEQIKRLENPEMFEIEGIGKELKQLQKDMETKAEELAKKTKSKLIDEKREKLLQIHTKKQNKKISNRIGIPLSNEEKEILSGLAKELVGMDLDKQSVRTISIRANIEQLCEKLRKTGFVHPIKNQACSCERAVLLSDVEIIKHYNSVIRGTLYWFSGADNYQKVKSVVESILRKSCLLTLKRKFKMKSIQQALDIYGRDVAVIIQNKTYSLITKDEVARYRNSFNLSKGKSENEFDLYKIMDKVECGSHGLTFFHNCAVVRCENKDVEIHHINKLQRKKNKNGIFTIIDKKGRPVKGLKAVLTSINRKQISLCRLHYMEMEKGKYRELNKNILNEVLNRNSTKYPLKMPKDFKTVFEGNPFVYDKVNKNTNKL